MAIDEPALVQATAVAIGGRAVAFRGPPGSGKSSLALALIDRGAILVGDDGIQIERRGSQVIVSPPPHIAGKLEIRNLGLVELPTTTAPLGLILDLAQKAERYREQAEVSELLGIPVPALPFDPGHIAPAVRAEWALQIHGLAFS